MKHPVLGIVFACMSLISTGEPATQQRALAADARSQQKTAVPNAISESAEEAIKHLLLSQVEAWNRGSLERFMRGYWHSPDLTFFSGATVTKGWEPTLARYKERYQSQGKEMGRLEFQDLNIDMLGPKGAVVTGTWRLTMSDGKQPHGLFTLILKRMQEGWRIVHDHTSAE
jgi:ketosteroid isomerase-like protein